MFRITARTVLELGSELISSDIIAFYELIKNGFDARTTNGVEVRFDITLPRKNYLKLRQYLESCQTLDVAKEKIRSELHSYSVNPTRYLFLDKIDQAENMDELKLAFEEGQKQFNSIAIIDSGLGMSSIELTQNFLVIGTASRKKDVDEAIERGDANSPYLGEKGIGRLSAMRLGERLRVETARASDLNINILEIDWTAFKNIDAMLDQIKVEPKIGEAKVRKDYSGTKIIISDLLESWSSDRVKQMAEYEFARLTDPFNDVGNRPRIAIFWNNDRIAIPFMPKVLLDAAHASVKGSYEFVDGSPVLVCELEARDLGFEHPKERQVLRITEEDLQSLIFGKESHVDDNALKNLGNFSFEAYWYNRRRLAAIDSVGDLRAVREMQDKWSGILLFRDKFRVFPYGEDDDDWLELDRKALRRSGYTLNKTQFVGHVKITRTKNPQLVDQTNREGLRETPQQYVFLRILRYAIQRSLGEFMNDVERQYKSQKVDFSDAQTKVARLEERAKIAIKQLKRIAPKGGDLSPNFHPYLARVLGSIYGLMRPSFLV